MTALATFSGVSGIRGMVLTAGLPGLRFALEREVESAMA